MRCLIETVKRGGISGAREIETGHLSLGCGEDQDVRLQSRRAGLRHAVIEPNKAGKLCIRAIAPNRILYNGKDVDEAVLSPGDEFKIGRICIAVKEAPDTFHLNLEIKETAGKQSMELEDALLASLNTDSKAGGFSMRHTAWILSLAILILFLITPLIGFIYKPFGAWLRTVPVVSDLSWNSGSISSAHSFIADDCNRCHERAFVSVENSACTSCHKDTPHHFKAGSDNVDSLKFNRCASCHKEHSGSEVLALANHNDALCYDCHENIKAIAPNSKLPDVSDFGNNHPEFKATIATFAEGKLQSVRIPLDQKKPLQEKANFEFSHAAHLKEKGIKSPDRGIVKLDCADCHQPDPGGKYMTKLDFESQCHDCHKLNFEAENPKHELPHGDYLTIQKYLEGYYAARALQGNYRYLSAPQVIKDRLRPGEELTPSENLKIKEWASKYARDMNSEIMRFRVCGKCHTVSQNVEKNAQPPWRIEPLVFSARKFPKADFDHDKHKTQDCQDCHDAEKSEHSEDVLLKGIETCRECHGGIDAKNKVASTCIDCHGFHTSQNLTMDGKKITLPAKVGAFPEINYLPLVSA